MVWINKTLAPQDHYFSSCYVVKRLINCWILVHRTHHHSTTTTTTYYTSTRVFSSVSEHVKPSLYKYLNMLRIFFKVELCGFALQIPKWVWYSLIYILRHSHIVHSLSISLYTLWLFLFSESQCVIINIWTFCASILQRTTIDSHFSSVEVSFSVLNETALKARITHKKKKISIWCNAFLYISLCCNFSVVCVTNPVSHFLQLLLLYLFFQCSYIE